MTSLAETHMHIEFHVRHSSWRQLSCIVPCDQILQRRQRVLTENAWPHDFQLFYIIGARYAQPQVQFTTITSQRVHAQYLLLPCTCHTLRG